MCNKSKKRNTVRLARDGCVYINNEVAGTHEFALSGWFCAHYKAPDSNFYQNSKADTRSGLRELISKTINQ